MFWTTSPNDVFPSDSLQVCLYTDQHGLHWLSARPFGQEGRWHRGSSDVPQTVPLSSIASSGHLTQCIAGERCAVLFSEQYRAAPRTSLLTKQDEQSIWSPSNKIAALASSAVSSVKSRLLNLRPGRRDAAGSALQSLDVVRATYSKSGDGTAMITALTDDEPPPAPMSRPFSGFVQRSDGTPADPSASPAATAAATAVPHDAGAAAARVAAQMRSRKSSANDDGGGDDEEIVLPSCGIVKIGRSSSQLESLEPPPSADVAAACGSSSLGAAASGSLRRQADRDARATGSQRPCSSSLSATALPPSAVAGTDLAEPTTPAALPGLPAAAAGCSRSAERVDCAAAAAAATVPTAGLGSIPAASHADGPQPADGGDAAAPAATAAAGKELRACATEPRLSALYDERLLLEDFEEIRHIDGNARKLYSSLMKSSFSDDSIVYHAEEDSSHDDAAAAARQHEQPAFVSKVKSKFSQVSEMIGGGPSGGSPAQRRRKQLLELRLLNNMLKSNMRFKHCNTRVMLL